MSTLKLEGGRVLCPVTGRNERADVLLRDGLIQAVGAGLGPADESLDCEGAVVCPALVDLDAELCDPGVTWRETLVTGSRAAAAGGFTTVLASPATSPAVDDAAIVRELAARAEREACIEIRVAGGLTEGLKGEELAELGLMAEAGAVAFSNGDRLVPDSLVLRNALLYARPFGLPVLLRAGERELESVASMHEGPTSLLAGLRGLPAAAEELAVARLISLARYTGCHVHVLGVTTALALAWLRRARQEGVPITGTTIALHTLLVDEAVLESGYDPNTRLLPPLREETDRKAVLDALRDGTLLGATSGHRPRTLVDKELEFAHAVPGAVGLETALGCVLAGSGDLSVAIRALSTGPARLLGLDRRVAEGAPAELVVVQPDQNWTVDPARMHSKCGNTPLTGRRLPGLVRATLHRGAVVHRSA